METNVVYIYGLKEEDSDLIRYVGKSVNPSKRLKKHILDSNKKRTHKDCWIYSVLRKNKNINFVILENTTDKDWPEKEIYWINFYKKNLVNHCSGGRGGRPIKYKLSYEEFKKWVNKNLPNIKTSSQWNMYFKNKKPIKKITQYPADTYKNRGWKGWAHLLNTNHKNYSHNTFLNYTDCKKYIKKYNIKTKKEWNVIKKRLEKFIPKNPESFYLKSKTWLGWRDFLQSKEIRKNKNKYYSFKDCKEYIKNFYTNMTSNKWRNPNFQKNIPDFIPNKPDVVFKKTKEWISWGDFLSTNSVSTQKKFFLSYNDAKKIVNNLNIKSNIEWRKYCKSNNKPINIPSCPDITYKKEWTNWNEWLGKIK